MFRVYLYARVSTNDQQTLPCKNRAMREYAARRGWTITMQVREVGSGAAQRESREKLPEAARRSSAENSQYFHDSDSERERSASYSYHRTKCPCDSRRRIRRSKRIRHSSLRGQDSINIRGLTFVVVDNESWGNLKRHPSLAKLSVAT
jgi:hypothetical protein